MTKLCFQQGTKYNIRQTTLGQYVDDLKAGNKRAKNSYMAVQNIKKALPQLQVGWQTVAANLYYYIVHSTTCT